ncbi:hypothetical protein CHS0354_000286 [Potamilus streckersoni]|uniref:C-type lectin domain-containing protein n=1 Tax=Potamilus streckersoni TaxID=2493646 RepID=A0AAE0RYJ3_9BIVA|nr:hypothetical protein CHS0354_000286 [Potamilus streckersoni]
MFIRVELNEKLLKATSDITDLCPYNLQRGPQLRVFEHSDSCYEFMSHRHDSWYNAQKDCLSKGGHLVVINNIEEENFIMSVLGSLNFGGLGVWIGLNDIAEEGVFKWITGTSPQFTYWGARQGPNAGALHVAHGIEDCVLLKFSDSGHWHDYPCESIALLLENYGWICQYSMASLSLSGLATTSVVPTTSDVPTSPGESITSGELTTTSQTET